MSRLNLSDAIRIQSDAIPEVDISADSRLIFAVTPGNGSNAAILVANNCGTLVPLSSIPNDPAYPQVDSGGVDENFTTFAITEENLVDRGRIKIYHYCGSLHGFVAGPTREFTDYATDTFSFNGGVVSPDGKYVAVTYIQTPNIDNSGILRILSTENLQDVATTPISGFTNGARFVEFQGSTYVYLVTTQGFFSADVNVFRQPSTLSLFRLGRRGLVLAGSAPLPQFSSNQSAVVVDDKIRIVVGTRRADSPSQRSIAPTTPNEESLLFGDSNELRLYEYEGKELRLVYSKNTGGNTRPVQLSRDGSLLFYGITSPINSTSQTGVLSRVLKRRDTEEEEELKHHKCSNLVRAELQLRTLDVSVVVPSVDIDASISRDSKWLVLAGSSTADTPFLNNLAIYNLSERDDTHIVRYSYAEDISRENKLQESHL